MTMPPHESNVQHRAVSDDRPASWWDHPDQDGLWCDDREEAEDVAEVLRDLGSRGVRIESRTVGGE
jgi:hypothetical protein